MGHFPERREAQELMGAEDKEIVRKETKVGSDKLTGSLFAHLSA